MTTEKETAQYNIYDAKTGDRVIANIALGVAETEELSAESDEGFSRICDHSDLASAGHEVASTQRVYATLVPSDGKAHLYCST